MIHLMEETKDSRPNRMIPVLKPSAQDSPEQADPVDIAPMLASIGDIASVRRQADEWPLK